MKIYIDMGIFKKIWRKLEGVTEKIYTDRKTGENFIAFVLTLGAVGVFFCLVWFALLCKQGIPLGLLIFDIAIIVFCAWAIIKGVIPLAKDAFKHEIFKDKTDKI